MHQSMRTLQLSIWCHLPRASVTCNHVPAAWTRSPGGGRTVRLHVGAFLYIEQGRGIGDKTVWHPCDWATL